MSLMLFKRKGNDGPSPNVPIDVPDSGQASPIQTPIGWQQPLPVSLSPSAEAEIRELIGRKQKIQAIKVMREQTGLGLKDAKDLVEALAAGRPVAAAPAYPLSPEPLRPGLLSPEPLSPEPSLSDRVRTFETGGDHASAVALVRAQTGMTTSEAEAFIRALTECVTVPVKSPAVAASGIAMVRVGFQVSWLLPVPPVWE